MSAGAGRRASVPSGSPVPDSSGHARHGQHRLDSLNTSQGHLDVRNSPVPGKSVSAGASPTKLFHHLSPDRSPRRSLSLLPRFLRDKRGGGAGGGGADPPVPIEKDDEGALAATSTTTTTMGGLDHRARIRTELESVHRVSTDINEDEDDDNDAIEPVEEDAQEDPSSAAPSEFDEEGFGDDDDLVSLIDETVYERIERELNELERDEFQLGVRFLIAEQGMRIGECLSSGYSCNSQIQDEWMTCFEALTRSRHLDPAVF